jgi:hypothetical protein
MEYVVLGYHPSFLGAVVVVVDVVVVVAGRGGGWLQRTPTIDPHLLGFLF